MPSTDAVPRCNQIFFDVMGIHWRTNYHRPGRPPASLLSVMGEMNAELHNHPDFELNTFVPRSRRLRWLVSGVRWAKGDLGCTVGAIQAKISQTWIR